ncbi:putative short-chain dehydrogenase/reductase [Kluyveromyces lactis]|uniref:KLLA0D05907p n=1 Tax=Kluyveromyces lactis (strain ATCC 8585 / CBS 2359 / DSM 70799 / NBRC 1267 / NRRL Y-1140 / WM37) TaxID=284590 RepID=Q6CRW4_KLULA|nr:uncharacterized protein KLLA0_D05907g [Kluyveromyces lactis]CAH00421.1 KLLA0D05907p [Kluyveromyces lactis]|eukprot:XP_453325.1 uncharacterized protein KLLA0_D05907g [Kluyveromyces lactis]
MKTNPDIVYTKAQKLIELNLDNKYVAIVGGTGGIGRELARVLAQKGAKVIVVGRTFRDENVEGIEFIQADLGLVSEASRVAELLPAEKLDLLIFTTGVLAPPARRETSEGLEEDLAVSYISRLVMMNHLVPRLKEHGEKKPRVFVMGFPGDNYMGDYRDLNSEESYGAISTHMKTVAGNEALVLDFKNRFATVNFYGLNPGLIRTNIRDNYLGKDTWKSRVVEWFIGMTNQTAEQYAEKLGPLLVAPELETHSGAMFDKNANPILPSKDFTDDYARNYIKASEELLANLKLAQ